MDSIEYVISKILESKTTEDLEEVKIDLKRIVKMQLDDDIDMGYINYLFKYYQNEISMIKSVLMSINMGAANYNIVPTEDIRNYLIKIAIIRICKEKGIKYCIENMNSVDYCVGLINSIN